MSALNVVAVLTAKPGSEDVVSGALAKLAAATREEEGCVSYELLVSRADPSTFITIEQWQSQGHLDAHMQAPHVAEAFATAGDHLAAAPAIHPLDPVA